MIVVVVEAISNFFTNRRMPTTILSFELCAARFRTDLYVQEEFSLFFVKLQGIQQFGFHFTSIQTR